MAKKSYNNFLEPNGSGTKKIAKMVTNEYDNPAWAEWSSWAEPDCEKKLRNEMGKKVISTDEAPQAIGPYSQAVQMAGWLFVSGQIALDPSTGELIEGDIRTQTRRVMDNLKAIVEAAGGSLADVGKCTIYLKNLKDFATVNDIYGSYFGTDPPARATVEVVGLPKNVDVEIDAIAYLGH